jgi:hypothetical protein
MGSKRVKIILLVGLVFLSGITTIVAADVALRRWIYR